MKALLSFEHGFDGDCFFIEPIYHVMRVLFYRFNLPFLFVYAQFHLPYLDHRPFKGDTFAITSTGFTGIGGIPTPLKVFESVVLNFIIQGGIFRKRVLFLGYRGVSPKHTEQHSLAKSMVTLLQSQSDTSSCEV